MSNLIEYLETLVAYIAVKDGLALDPTGQVQESDMRLLTQVLRADTNTTQTLTIVSVEFLCALAESVGLLRQRSGRLEATSVCHPWHALDPDLKAGLIYTAWCNRAAWQLPLADGPDQPVQALRAGRASVLKLLIATVDEGDVDLAGILLAVAERLLLPNDPWLRGAIMMVFVEPLVDLGVASLDPPPPAAPRTVRLRPRGRQVIGSALLAAGDDVPPSAP